MFLQKLRRLFFNHQKKKSGKGKKKSQLNQSQDQLILSNAPPSFIDYDNAIVEQQTPPKLEKFNRLFQNNDLTIYEENKFALTTSTTATTKLPPFRKTSLWQGSKPFAQNALRYRHCCYRGNRTRFNSSRSKTFSYRVSMNLQ
uniref:Uncharacterized protein n=1 Tax=Panagrolaimus sp. ES5 TaxID=591445 RepID=A0AC34GSP7_9BILA